MRTRPRPRPFAMAATAAAVTAASLPLWASTAAAGDEPDEVQQRTRTVQVGDVACEVRLHSYRYTTSVYGSTEVVTDAEQCRTTQVFVNAEFLSRRGDTVAASTATTGPLAEVAGGGATDLLRTYHGVTFAAGPSAYFTMESK